MTSAANSNPNHSLTQGPTAGSRPSLPLIGIMAGLAFLLMAGLFAHRDILGVDIMEARNLITAHEMIATGHWLLPTLHGELRLAKPPLPTWLTAWAMLLGNAGRDTDLAVDRLPSALAGLLLAASLFGLTRFWTKSTAAAAWSTAFLSTSYMFVLMARRNTWDIYCHAFMLAAIWVMAVILESPEPRKRLAVLAGLLLALSGLSKGPVSWFAVLLPWALALLATGKGAAFRAHGRDLALALALGLVLSSSWFLTAWLAVPHDFSRMLNTEQQAWGMQHTKPFWFYLQFPFMTGIWSLMACAALWPAHARARVEALLPYWRPALWTLFSVGLLMCIPEKKDRYLLPVLIPLCQLMGIYLTGLLRDPGRIECAGKIIILANTWLFMLAAMGTGGAIWLARAHFPAMTISGLLAITAGSMLLGLLLRRQYQMGNMQQLFLFKFAMLALLGLGVPFLAQPNPGNISVPLEQIRAFSGAVPVLQDGSLKFQDAWILGRDPRKLEGLLPDRFCFVSRKKDCALPDTLQNFSVETRLDISDFSGDALHCAMVRRNEP